MSSPERPASLDQTSPIKTHVQPIDDPEATVVGGDRSSDIAPDPSPSHVGAAAVHEVGADGSSHVAADRSSDVGVADSPDVHVAGSSDTAADGSYEVGAARSPEVADDREGPGAPTIWDQMGGPMGMLDSGLPVVVFVIVNAITSLGWAVGAALAAGVIIAIARLVRRKPVTQAIAGLFGVGIAAFIAYRTGSAKGYFLFGIWSFVVYGSALLLSIIARWPLVGVLWESINGRGTAWRKDRKLVRRYDYATAVWVVVFAARFAVQNQLYAADKVGWLATARLLMGYPVYLLAIVATVLIVGSANGMSLPSMKTVLGRRKSAEAADQSPDHTSRAESTRGGSSRDDASPTRSVVESGTSTSRIGTSPGQSGSSTSGADSRTSSAGNAE